MAKEQTDLDVLNAAAAAVVERAGKSAAERAKFNALPAKHRETLLAGAADARERAAGQK